MQTPKQIPPTMTHLPKLVDTYAAVCGDNNPFAAASGMDPAAYGFSAADIQAFMIALHGMTPVMDDYAKLSAQINCTMTAYATKYAAMYAAETAAAVMTPGMDVDYTDTTTHTGTVRDGKAGTETKTRTGSVSDSGSDSTTTGNTVTDSVKTYDSNTYKETQKTVSSGTGSLTHGKTTTYNSIADTTGFADRVDTKTLNTVDARTVSGYRSNPVKLLSDYDDFVRNNNVFMEVVNDVLRAISCKIYIPYVTEEMEDIL